MSRMFVSAAYFVLILSGFCVFDMYLRLFSAGMAENWNINCDSFLIFGNWGGRVYFHPSELEILCFNLFLRFFCLNC